MIKHVGLVGGAVMLAIAALVFLMLSQPEFLSVGQTESAPTSYQATPEEVQTLNEVMEADTAEQALDEAEDDLDASLDAALEADFDASGLDDEALGL